MALAAYNVGYGHLTDARKLTKLDGGDSSRWMDVKDYLPRLSQKRYYKNTRHGYARGNEPVSYVQNIRRYFDVLVWNETNNNKQINETNLNNTNDFNESELALEGKPLQLSANVRVIPPLL